MGVTLCFLFLCLPYTIFIILCIIFQREIDYSSNTYKIMDIISLSNNSVNFFIYYLSGCKFRDEFFKIFCPWRRQKKKRESTIRVQSYPMVSRQHPVNTNNSVNTL
jgi:hypothetical protein